MRARKIDEAQPEIVRQMRAVGAWVLPLNAEFDVLAGFRGRWHLFEIKSGEKQSRRKSATAERQAGYRRQAEAVGCTIHLVWTPEMALKAIGAIK
jgi:hypothetical protein